MAAKPSQPLEDRTDRTASDTCSTPIDRFAPAGSKSSLGAKSDCNGRPTTDDSVVEAKDEMPPLPTPRAGEENNR